MDIIRDLHPLIQTLLATCFTWLMTALGAAGVFMSKDLGRRVLDGMLGFAAGVMVAASFWSLLVPAIEMSRGKDIPEWFPAVAGFLGGGLFLQGIDKVLPHLHIGFPIEEAEGISTSWKRSTLLILAITLHNIPEGLAVGIAFGAITSGLSTATLTGAIALAIGIGIQNFPEGLAVSLPLRREGMSSLRSFWYGQLSAIVEPVAGIIGAASVILARPILPYALGFAAGAMIFVVVEELVPESQRGGNADLATMGSMAGFALMTILDVAFA
ncbi:MAG: ZIP family metal transporter [Nitrospirota bacterium]